MGEQTADTERSITAPAEPAARLDRTDESQDFVDQSVMDFDPDAGLYSGTVVTGNTAIDGPHIGEDGRVDEKEQQEFLEQGREQARENGLLDEDGAPKAR